MVELRWYDKYIIDILYKIKNNYKKFKIYIIIFIIIYFYIWYIKLNNKNINILNFIK